MLNFSLASVLMAFITSNLLIMILTLIFLYEPMLYKSGVQVLGVFCVLVVARMAFPFEITGISININFPRLVSRILTFVRYPRVRISGIGISIWHIAILIWGIVFIVKFIFYIKSVKKVYRFIDDYGTDTTSSYRQLINSLCKKGLRERVLVIKLPMITSPSVFLYNTHYYILLPDKLELDEEETGLVLKHEIAHITHHDLVVKFLLQVLYLFYWWNIFCKKLKKQTDLLFELRVDFSIVSMGGSRSTKRYLSCLLKVKEYGENNDNQVTLPSAICLLTEKSSLNKRFRFIMENGSSGNKLITSSILTFVCTIFLLSFVFIFEGYYMSPKNCTSCESLTDENIYIIKSRHNTYDIYFNGKYAETVNSLENYPEDCKIYLSLEEAHKNEET